MQQQEVVWFSRSLCEVEIGCGRTNPHFSQKDARNGAPTFWGN